MLFEKMSKQILEGSRFDRVEVNRIFKSGQAGEPV